MPPIFPPPRKRGQLIPSYWVPLPVLSSSSLCCWPSWPSSASSTPEASVSFSAASWAPLSESGNTSSAVALHCRCQRLLLRARYWHLHRLAHAKQYRSCPQYRLRLPPHRGRNHLPNHRSAPPTLL